MKNPDIAHIELAQAKIKKSEGYLKQYCASMVIGIIALIAAVVQAVQGVSWLVLIPEDAIFLASLIFCGVRYADMQRLTTEAMKLLKENDPYGIL